MHCIKAAWHLLASMPLLVKQSSCFLQQASRPSQGFSPIMAHASGFQHHYQCSLMQATGGHFTRATFVTNTTVLPISYIYLCAGFFMACSGTRWILITTPAVHVCLVLQVWDTLRILLGLAAAHPDFQLLLGTWPVSGIVSYGSLRQQQRENPGAQVAIHQVLYLIALLSSSTGSTCMPAHALISATADWQGLASSSLCVLKAGRVCCNCRLTSSK